MKLKLYHIIAAILGLIALSSCEKVGGKGNGEPGTPEYDVICQYEFDGKSYDVYTARYVEDDFEYTFIFSPLTPDKQITTYAMVAISKDWSGTNADVTSMVHNYDYRFRYEDPVHSFSEYWKLTGGTIFIKENREGNFTISMDIGMQDGTPFKMEYTGPIQKAVTAED